ncbi:MAG: septal ring lytic transglycosylase RlpA family protein [Methylobacter sp.]|uniref:septal ring lytic transglycosylase RlpA family protein n=1 Tax=Methylobacter sp. TaxID=2051955 RepID=UPI0025F42B75|nr:septal ring lytic transglycosylase RlpA family protein [Methylobacter sp.]MCK9619218.1 septal ring lytic transglycosylase RlpA family protein [Methylobacter sp.]
MLYQTVQHCESSPKDVKCRLIYTPDHGAWNVTIPPSVTLCLRKQLLGVLPVTVICALALLGCNSEHSNEQAKQAQQQKESAATAPVHKEVGEASWYGPGFHGKETSSGEAFNQQEMTAAHPSLPMGTKAEVTNLENDKKVEVRINDRGPYAENRVIDLSSAAANKLDMKTDGTAQVKIVTKSAKKKSRTAHSKKTKQRAKKSVITK